MKKIEEKRKDLISRPSSDLSKNVKHAKLSDESDEKVNVIIEDAETIIEETKKSEKATEEKQGTTKPKTPTGKNKWQWWLLAGIIGLLCILLFLYLQRLIGIIKNTSTATSTTADKNLLQILLWIGIPSIIIILFTIASLSKLIKEFPNILKADFDKGIIFRIIGTYSAYLLLILYVLPTAAPFPSTLIYRGQFFWPIHAVLLIAIPILLLKITTFGWIVQISIFATLAILLLFIARPDLAHKTLSYFGKIQTEGKFQEVIAKNNEAKMRTDIRKVEEIEKRISTDQNNPIPLNAEDEAMLYNTASQYSTPKKPQPGTVLAEAVKKLPLNKTVHTNVFVSPEWVAMGVSCFLTQESKSDTTYWYVNGKSGKDIQIRTHTGSVRIHSPGEITLRGGNKKPAAVVKIQIIYKPRKKS